MATIAAAFAVEDVLVPDDVPERYNVAPTDPVCAVVQRPAPGRPQGVRALELFRWGLVPSWAKDASGGARMINARAEGVATKPAFRQALAMRRAIVPLDTFYEWQPLAGQGGRRQPKQPWAVARRDGRPMAAAGLWEAWRDRSGDGWLLTCTIITTAPNRLVEPIHDRMPVLLSEAGVDVWLDPSSHQSELLDLLVPCPASELEAWPVSNAVNRVGTEGAGLLDPVPRQLA